jgi:DNA-directed RNA polymerase subunit RPC12/RpoP
MNMKLQQRYQFRIVEPKHIDPNSGQELVNAPEPEPLESPASWLSRLALMQGAPVKDLLSYLNIDKQRDIDLQIATLDTAHLARVCGLPESSFSFMKHMFVQLREIDGDGKTFLLQKDSLARYRFCPRCLGEQHTPHFPLHWRFKAWRWCPLHNCLLSDFCPRCRAVVVMPMNMLNAGRRGLGIAHLFNCQVCGSKLMNKPKAKRIKVSKYRLSTNDHFLLANGRTLLSALYHTKFKIGASPQKYPVSAIRGLETHGYFPPEVMRYELNEPNPKPRYRHPFSNHLLGRS